jgi:hypothetical protein
MLERWCCRDLGGLLTIVSRGWCRLAAGQQPGEFTYWTSRLGLSSTNSPFLASTSTRCYEMPSLPRQAQDRNQHASELARMLVRNRDLVRGRRCRQHRQRHHVQHHQPQLCRFYRFAAGRYYLRCCRRICKGEAGNIQVQLQVETPCLSIVFLEGCSIFSFINSGVARQARDDFKEN